MTPTYTQVRGGTPGGEGTWTLSSVDLEGKYNAADRPTINLTNGYIEGAPLTVLSPLGLICDPCKGTDPGLSAVPSFPEPVSASRTICLATERRPYALASPLSTNASARTILILALARSGRTSCREPPSITATLRVSRRARWIPRPSFNFARHDRLAHQRYDADHLLLVQQAFSGSWQARFTLDLSLLRQPRRTPDGSAPSERPARG